MAVVYRYVGILNVYVIFFRIPGVFHSHDSSPSMFHPWLWETSSGVVALGVFAAEAHRELWARPSRLHLKDVEHAYCCYVIGQHLDNWNLIGRFLYRCSFWSEVSLCTFLMPDTKRGRNPENGRSRDFGRRWRHRQSGFQHADRSRASSPELINKDHNASRESLSSHLNYDMPYNIQF